MIDDESEDEDETSDDDDFVVGPTVVPAEAKTGEEVSANETGKTVQYLKI